MGFAEIQAAFAQNAPAPVQPTPAPAAFAPTVQNTFTPQPSAGVSFPTPLFAPAAAPAPAPLQGSFAFTPPAGFVPSSAPPINPPGERAALTAPEPVGVQAVADIVAPDPPKAKRGRKPKADVVATNVTPTEARAVADFIASQPTEYAAPASIEALVRSLYALGVSSVHLTFSKEGA